MKTLIEAKNLTKRYDNKLALDELNLNIREGEIFSLLGENGAGKSTTINLFLGFLKPTSGQAFINGIEVQSNLEKIKQHIAYIPENVMLYGNLTGLENLDLFSSIAGKKLKNEDLQRLALNAGLSSDSLNKKFHPILKG